eukprot:1541297-Heterocapsa_arctica.AAC.1
MVGREFWTAVVGQVVGVAPHLKVHLRAVVVVVLGVEVGVVVVIVVVVVVVIVVGDDLLDLDRRGVGDVVVVVVEHGEGAANGIAKHPG